MWSVIDNRPARSSFDDIWNAVEPNDIMQHIHAKTGYNANAPLEERSKQASEIVAVWQNVRKKCANPYIMTDFPSTELYLSSLSAADAASIDCLQQTQCQAGCKGCSKKDSTQMYEDFQVELGQALSTGTCQ